MKIIKEPMPVRYRAEIPEYCCDNFKHFEDWFSITTTGIYMKNPQPREGYYGGQSGHCRYSSMVNYCPFCGERVYAPEPDVNLAAFD